MFFLITLYLQLIEHYSAIGTGLAILPVPVVMSPVAAQMRRLIARHGYRRYLILGPALVAAGMAWACFLPVHGNYPLHLLPALLVMPAGYGMTYPSAYAAATSGVPARQPGLTSGLITTAQQIGGAVGLAVISAVAASYTASLTRDPAPQALTSGYDLAMAVAAGFTFGGLGRRGHRRPGRPPRPGPAAGRHGARYTGGTWQDRGLTAASLARPADGLNGNSKPCSPRAAWLGRRYSAASAPVGRVGPTVGFGVGLRAG
jgi:MFS family permease